MDEHTDFTETSGAYDNFGRITKSVDFEGRTTLYDYDDGPSALVTHRLIAKRYFDAGHSLSGPADQTITYTLDALGRQVTITDTAAATATTQQFDALGRLQKVTSPEGTVNYEYNALGLQTRTYTGASQPMSVTSTVYGYDTLGRLQTVTAERRNAANISPTEATTYHYDAVGNLDYQVFLKGNDYTTSLTTDYEYDNGNRLVHEWQYGPGSS